MRRFKPGITFSDFVITGSSVTPSKIKEQQLTPKLNYLLMWGGMGILVFLVLVSRVLTLQVFQGEKYLLLAEQNRIKYINLPAPRGEIFDRNGKILKGPNFAHLLGFVSEVNQDEVGLLLPGGRKYKMGDKVGRAGVELLQDSTLRGEDGDRLVEVDSVGKEVRVLGTKLPVSGKPVHLTIDADLQNMAMAGLNGKPGAVVASNPQTGEILVLASSPTFDPEAIKKNSPMFNRAVGGTYPPGSTFKPVTVVAAMTDGGLGSNFTVDDTGVITVAGFKYANWFWTQFGRTEGTVGWIKAIQRSNDIFFYKVGEKTGAETLSTWAKRYGFGQKTSLNFPGEAAGLVPSPTWKERTLGEKWFLGNTYHFAIGQGDLLATPLQVNQMTNMIGTNKKCQYSLFTLRDSPCEPIDVSENILKIIREGMVGACQDGGTAYPFFEWTGPEVACKTGTAEYINDKGKYGTHAWFTIFAPSDNPQISVTVLVEGGGEGSRVAAPIARKILSAYFNLEDKYNYGAITGQGE
jgi:penicillin-binding protein 2